MVLLDRYSTSNTNYTEKNYLKKLKDFHDIYLTISTFTLEILRSSLSQDVRITIRSLEKFPEFNYLDKYWNDIDFSKQDYENNYKIEFLDDKHLHFLLYRHEEKFIYGSNNNKDFIISDKEIYSLCRWPLSDIRFFLISAEIPIKIEGNKTINNI